MPDPHVIEVAIAAKSRTTRDSLVSALTALAADDLSFGVSADAESGQIVLKGVSELQLDAHIATLKRSYGIDVDVGTPQVAYRETLTRRIEKDYTFKKRTGGARRFARIKMVFTPDAEGGFESKIVGGAVPDDFIVSVAAGIESAMRCGILAGFPVVGVKSILIDGAFHDTDSSTDAFKIAACAAFREGLREGGPILLEPVMQIEVTIPEDYLGFVTGDVHARRGRVQGQVVRDDAIAVEALVPLANLFGYDNQLRSGTQAHGSYTMRFSHYAPTPPRPDDDGPAAPAVALRG